LRFTLSAHLKNFVIKDSPNDVLAFVVNVHSVRCFAKKFLEHIQRVEHMRGFFINISTKAHCSCDKQRINVSDHLGVSGGKWK
jgi:hypothetical protein